MNSNAHLTKEEELDPNAFEPSTPSMRDERRAKDDENEYLFFASELEETVDGDYEPKNVVEEDDDD